MTTDVTVNYTAHTREYMGLLHEFSECVANKTKDPSTNNSAVICDSCWSDYKLLYNFYWDVFIQPEVEFCLDVQATVSSFTSKF